MIKKRVQHYREISKVAWALERSIKKWEDISRGLKRDRGSRDCALCELFLVDNFCCVRCPVFRAAGKPYCENTPIPARVFSGDPLTPEYFKEAAEMANYLRGLRKLVSAWTA